MSDDNVQVKIYSTPTCMYCKLAKEFFDEKGVSYSDINVAEDEDARNEMIEKTGQMGVPVINVGDEYVVGFDKEKIAGLLGIEA